MMMMMISDIWSLSSDQHQPDSPTTAQLSQNEPNNHRSFHHMNTTDRRESQSGLDWSQSVRMKMKMETLKLNRRHKSF